MPAGSFAGALLVSYMADRIGRKKTVILSGIIWIIGSTLQCAAIVCTSPSFSHVYPEPSNRIV
jgi:MFS family permease